MPLQPQMLEIPKNECMNRISHERHLILAADLLNFYLMAETTNKS